MAKMYGGPSKYLLDQERKYGGWNILIICAPILLIVMPVYFWLIFLGWQSNNIFSAIFTIFALLIVFIIAEHNVVKNKRKADKFYRGRKAEGAVWYELCKLSDEYHVLQDVKLEEKWNIDFIVVGPTGVFAIEVKSHQGMIRFNGKELTHNWSVFNEKDILWQAMSQATALHDLLKIKINADIFVNPIIVFASSFAYVRFWLNKVGGVFVIKKRLLKKLICDRGRVFGDEKVKIIVSALLPFVSDQTFL